MTSEAVLGRPETGAEDAAGDGPIYVAGLDRCGKTTLSAFLTSHSRISIPAVGSNMWTYFYRQYGDLANDADLERCLDALFTYKHVVFLKPDRDRVRAEFIAGPRTYARLFSLFLRHFAESAGKARWGAQTGLIERYGDEIIEAYPGLRVVHMVRDPRDRYLASLEKWPDGRLRAGGATARWRYSTGLGERHASRYPTQYLMIRFEDLIRDTEGTLRHVCDFLGEAYEPAMAGMPSAPKHRGRLLGDDEPSSDLPVDKILSEEHIGRFAGRVPDLELAFMQRHAGRLMARYGYEPYELDLTVKERLRFGARVWPDQAARMAVWRTVEELQQRFPARVRRRPGKRMVVDPA
ncbi:MAG: sulfotransferase [Actinomycetota bacterium]